MVSAPEPAFTDESEVRALLGTLPGFDVETGLQVVRGRFPAYLNLLQKYLVLHGGAMEGFQAFLAAEEGAEALRLVHSLIGAAGFLGAKGVSEAAYQLEQAMRKPAPMEEIREKATALASEQAAFCAVIRALPSIPPRPTSEA